MATNRRASPERAAGIGVPCTAPVAPSGLVELLPGSCPAADAPAYCGPPLRGFRNKLSVRPGELALDLEPIMGAAPDHAVGPVLEAEEVERRLRVVAPGSCRWRADAQYGAFGHIDALAIHE